MNTTNANINHVECVNLIETRVCVYYPIRTWGLIGARVVYGVCASNLRAHNMISEKQAPQPALHFARV